jgi:hypothetical protein
MKGDMSLQSLTDLAAEYRENAKRLDEKINKLKSKRLELSTNDLYNLNQRIILYEDIRDSMKATANKLTHYYDE